MVSIAFMVLIIVLLMGDQSELSRFEVYNRIFRLLRVILLFRKLGNISRMAENKLKIAMDSQSPIEKIIKILGEVRQDVPEEPLIFKDIEWTVQIITSNKLYTPEIDEDSATDNKEFGTISNWLANFQQGSHKDQPKSKKTILNNTISNDDNDKRAILLPANIRNYLVESADDLSFDVFAFSAMAQPKLDIPYLMSHLFEINELFVKLRLNPKRFLDFTTKVQEGYLDNPYHNASHAADVIQTTNYFLTKGGFAEKAQLSPSEKAMMYLAACVHDFEHPGTNNIYQINFRTTFALRYNDKAVLEMHHISAAMALLIEDKYNFLSHLSNEDLKRFRDRMISMVLATDMSLHFSDLNKLKTRLTSGNFAITETDKNMCMEILIHAADISNPAKPFEVYSRWTDRVLEEFFHQGDLEREKGYAITPLMDRYTVNRAKSQIGFIQNIVLPLYEQVKGFLPQMEEAISNLHTNKKLWEGRIDEFEQELSNAT